MTRRILAAHRWIGLALPLAVLLMACTQKGDPATPGATAGTTTTPTTASTARASSTSTAPPPEAEVLAAYRRSWDVFADAFRALDTTRLDTAFAGAALQATRNQLAEAQTTGQAVHVDVTHDPQVIYLQGDRAVVQDAYTNRSAPIDPTTGQPIQVQPEIVHQRRTLTRLDGTWKVTDIVEEVPDP